MMTPGSNARRDIAAEGDTAQSASSPSLSAIAGEAVRFLGILTASVYTVGVIIVNIDLSRYGLATVDLAKSEYLFSGGLALFLVGLAGLGFRGALYAAHYAPFLFLHEHDPPDQQNAPSKGERILPFLVTIVSELWTAMARRFREARRRGLGSVIFTVAFLLPITILVFTVLIVVVLVTSATSILLYYIIWVMMLSLLSRQWYQNFLFFMTSIIVLTLIGFLPTYCREILKNWLRNRHLPGADLWFPFVFIMPYAAGALISYSYLVYPHLSPQWGGGRKEAIQVIFASEVTKATIPWADRQGFSLGSRGDVLAVKAYLLLETDQTLAITTRPVSATLDFNEREPPVVVVNKRLISAVLYNGALAERDPEPSISPDMKAR